MREKRSQKQCRREKCWLTTRGIPQETYLLQLKRPDTILCSANKYWPNLCKHHYPPQEQRISDCNNYQGISILSVVGKTFATARLPTKKTWFCPLRQLQEKCRELRRPLYISLINLTRAFDLVSRQGLFIPVTEDRMSSKASKDNLVFPWRHARHRPIR